MSDLLVLAFQTDLTRVATFPFANDGQQPALPDHRACPRGTTSSRTTATTRRSRRRSRRSTRFHIEQFAYLLGKLKASRRATSTLLDSSMLVYGSGIGDGNRHNHDDLPILLAGKGGGTIKARPAPEVSPRTRR